MGERRTKSPDAGAKSGGKSTQQPDVFHHTMHTPYRKRKRRRSMVVLLMSGLMGVVRSQESAVTTTPTTTMLLLPMVPVGTESSPVVAVSPASSPTIVTAQPTFAASVVATAVPTMPNVTSIPAPVSSSPSSIAPLTAAPTPNNTTRRNATSPAPITAAPTTLAPITPSPTTQVPSSFPSIWPSAPPTEWPTFEPSNNPSESPSTPSPTLPITENPSNTPSTPFPSAFPSEMPTTVPTGSIRAPPPFRGLAMTLEGVSLLESSSITVWETTTARFVESFFERETSFGVYDVMVKIVDTSQEISSTRRRKLSTQQQQQQQQHSALSQQRQLQQQLRLFFTATIRYRATDSHMNAWIVLEQPFFLNNRRSQYLEALRRTGDPSFRSLTSSQPLMRRPKPQKKKNGLSQTAIAMIVIICGVVMLLVIIVLAWFVYRRKSTHNKSYSAGMVDDASAFSAPSVVQNNPGNNNNSINSIVNNRSRRRSPSSKSRRARRMIGRDTGDQSVATVDFDYSKPYGGPVDPSVSSAGGTFGSNRTPPDLKSHGLASFASTDDSAAGRGGGNQSHVAAADDSVVREELLEIYAPPGKLGLVIAKPDDVTILVEVVKESSVIAGMLQPGDKLVAVDNQDVRTMKATKVSKLIRQRSTNPTRRLSIIRSTVVTLEEQQELA